MTPEKQHEIEDLIAIKKKVEQKTALDEAERQRMFKLGMANKKFMELSSADMQIRLDEMLADEEVEATYESEEADEIIGLYKLKYKNEPWFKEPTKAEDGKISLNFGSLKEEVNFDLQMAEANIKFMVVDKATNTVIAYSNGDGKLYHGDGEEFHPDDAYTPCSVPVDTFTLPEPAPRLE